MSIKSQTPGIASDLPLMSKQRNPKYISKDRNRYLDAKEGQIDTMSDYVRDNLKKTVKPRGGEHR